MSKVTATAYYQYDGPCPASPMRTPLTEEQLGRNLNLFDSDLTHSFPNTAKITTSERDMERREIKFSVEMNADRKQIVDILEQVLRRADLYGRFE